MAKSKLSIEHFLKGEKSAHFSLMAIIEEDLQNSQNVFVASWNKNTDSTDISFSIGKNQIDSVEETSNIHYSLGKEYKVVKVNFKQTAFINLNELFRQINTGTFRVFQYRRTDPLSRYPYGNDIA